ncbi:uncharacterized protein LJ206_007084 isoform 2-T2 [Theristicus caerulescens]
MEVFSVWFHEALSEESHTGGERVQEQGSSPRSEIYLFTVNPEPNNQLWQMYQPRGRNKRTDGRNFPREKRELLEEIRIRPAQVLFQQDEAIRHLA